MMHAANKVRQGLHLCGYLCFDVYYYLCFELKPLVPLPAWDSRSIGSVLVNERWKLCWKSVLTVWNSQNVVRWRCDSTHVGASPVVWVPTALCKTPAIEVKDVRLCFGMSQLLNVDTGNIEIAEWVCI